MEMEYILTKEQIKRINRKYGGSVRSDAEIETALEMGRGKGIYKKVSYLWMAMLVGNPFTDGNKRTAVGSAIVMLEAAGRPLQRRQRNALSVIAERVAERNMTNVAKTERRIRYAVEGD